MLHEIRTAGMRKLHRGVDRHDERLLWAVSNVGYAQRGAAGFRAPQNRLDRPDIKCRPSIHENKGS